MERAWALETHEGLGFDSIPMAKGVVLLRQHILFFKTSLYFLLSLIMCMSVCKHVRVNS